MSESDAYPRSGRPVVEDEKRMADLLRKGLEEEGYAVAVASEGTSAFEMAQAARFDLILLDVMLPGMDGFQVAHRLRARARGAPCTPSSA